MNLNDSAGVAEGPLFKVNFLSFIILMNYSNKNVEKFEFVFNLFFCFIFETSVICQLNLFLTLNSKRSNFPEYKRILTLEIIIHGLIMHHNVRRAQIVSGN